MQYCVLNEISANNPRDIVACKEQMMSRWMSRDSMATPPCWWMLVKAIERMGKNLVAKRIKKVHGKFYIKRSCVRGYSNLLCPFLSLNVVTKFNLILILQFTISRPSCLSMWKNLKLMFFESLNFFLARSRLIS